MPNAFGSNAIDGLYTEVAHTYSESGGFGDTPTAQVTLRMLESNKAAVVADIVGNLRPYPLARNPLMGGILPAIKYSAGPVADTTILETVTPGMVQHAYVDVVIQYGLPNDSKEKEGTSPTGVRFSEGILPYTEYLKLDHKRFIWINSSGDEIGPMLESEAPSLPFFGIIFKRTLKKVATIPATYYSACGKCNDDDVVSTVLGHTFPAETLLFKPGELKHDILLDGSSSGFEVPLEFVYKPHGWNKFFNPITQTWQEIGIRTTAMTIEVYKPVPPADFSGLFA